MNFSVNFFPQILKNSTDKVRHSTCGMGRNAIRYKGQTVICLKFGVLVAAIEVLL